MAAVRVNNSSFGNISRHEGTVKGKKKTYAEKLIELAHHVDFTNIGSGESAMKKPQKMHLGSKSILDSMMHKRSVRISTPVNVDHLVEHLKLVEGNLRPGLKLDREKCYAFQKSRQ